MTKLEKIREVITKAVSCGQNVLLEGPHGTGKSSLALGVAGKLGLRLKYFSAPTLDPFADLVGIPVPILDDGARRILYLRQEDVTQAEIIFFDELNRAHPKVLNTVFELIQFRSINGEKLPHLRSIIAVINPTVSSYQVQELDPALIDRFHIHARLTAGPSRDWFAARFGSTLGNALVNWFEADLDDKQRELISNRRLEYVGLCRMEGIDLQYAFPPNARLPLHLLEARLEENESSLTVEHFLQNPDKFASQVTTDLNVATRFGNLLPMMAPHQKAAVSDILLALPSEVLATLRSKFPPIFKKVRDGLAATKSKAEAEAFWDLVQERLNAIQ
jgi:hypothetical protein